jgi:hypothetical protein
MTVTTGSSQGHLELVLIFKIETKINYLINLKSPKIETRTQI